MSGPNNITIQVDVSGALQGIQGTQAAIQTLGATAQGVAPQMQALTAATSTTAAAVSAVQASASGNGLDVLKSTLEVGGALVDTITALDEVFKLSARSSGALGLILRRLPYVGLAIAAADLAVTLYELATSEDTAAKSNDLYCKALEQSNELLLTSEELARRRATAQRLATAETIKQAQAALMVEKQAAQERLRIAQAGMELEEKAAGNKGADGSMNKGETKAQAEKKLSTAQKEVTDLDARIAELQQRLEAVTTQTDSPDATAQRHAQRVAEARALTERAMNEWERWSVEQARLDSFLEDRLITQEVWNRLVEKGNPALRLQAFALEQMNEAMAQSQQELNSFMQEFDADLQLELAAQTRTPTQMAEDAKAALAGKQAEAAKAAEAQAGEVKKYADGVAKGWADAMFNQITGKGDSLKNWFKGLFKQIATDALKNRIIVPVTSALSNAVPGLFGLAAGAAGVGGTASAAKGGGFDPLGGLSGVLDSLDGGIAKLEGTLFGLAGKRGTATEGLLGKGGEFLGSADLATGVTGGLAGIGLGTTAAGLLGALGIGKGNTKGGAIGGAIGGIAGSFIPGLGTALGGLLGGAIGSLFGGKPSNKEGSAVIDLGSNNVAIGGFTGSKFSQENRDQAASMAKEVLNIKKTLEQTFGANITGTLAVGAGDRDGLFATGLNTTARTSFADSEAGAKKLVAFVTEQFVNGIRDQLAPEISAALGRVDFSDIEKASADLGFIRDFKDSMASLSQGYGLQNQVATAARAEVMAQTEAVKNFHDTTARLFPEALATADAALKKYVEGLVGIGEATPPMTRLETAMVAVRAQFEAYKPLLEEVGYTAEEAQTAIATGLAKAQGKLKDDFEADQNRALNEATGRGHLNQVGDLKTSLEQGRRDAAAVGADAGLVDQTVVAQLEKLLGGGNLDKVQLQEVIDQFGTAFPQAAAAAREAMDGLVTTTDEITKLNQSFKDRTFAATTDTSTEAGALAAFDRQANAERAEMAQKAGADLVALEAALTAERLRIQKDFADRLAATNLSIQDRLFAATADTSTLAGALSAFDRKVGQERAEIARTTGADLVTFDQATAAERLKIEKEFADRQAEISRGLADRAFALSVADDGDGEIKLLERRQNAEYAAAEAAGYTYDQLVQLQQVLAGEMTQAVKAVLEQTDALNLSIRDRLFAATTDTSTLNGALATFDRKTAQERAEIARTAGADLVTFDQATAAERLKIEKEFADRQAEISRGLADRAFALSVAGRDDAEIKLLERRQNAEFAAAEAAGYTIEQLTELQQVLAGEMTQAVQAVIDRTNDLNLSIQDRLFAAGTDTSTLAGSLAAFERQAAKERAEIAKTTGADLVSFDKAIGLERQAILKQFAEQAAAVNQGFADRLFAATNKADTAQGALAAFDRQAAKDRAEAAKVHGADLLTLERALAAERVNILQGFADQARDKLVTAMEAARDLADSWKEAGDSLRDALKADQLSGQYSSLNPEDQAKLAEDELRRLSARANDGSLTAQERLEAAQALPAARRAFLDAVRPLYEGTERWGEALDLSASLLDGVAQAADREADLATQQVDLAKGQLQALGIVNDSVLTVAEALDQYRQAQEKVEQAKNTPVVAPPVSQAPAAPAGQPANTNQPSVTQVRMDLLSNVAMTSTFGGQELLTWKRPDGSPIGLFRSDVVNGTLDYLTSIAQQIGLSGYQQGGIVGNGLYGVDSVLARYQDGGFIALAGGEFVTRAPSVTAETTPILRAINDTGRVPTSLKDKAALGTRRMEALLEGLLNQSAAAERRQIELDSRGYGAMSDQLAALLIQARDAAADNRRVAR